jgi:uncharacterized protein YxjI
MNPVFSHPKYNVKRQVFALTGKVRIFDPSGKLVIYCEQKMFKWREDLRAYADESKTRELLAIKARSIVDFSMAFDVVDPESGKVGVLRRKGLRSLLRDEWEVLNANDQPLGMLVEDSMGLALVRRFLSNLVPQNYDIRINDRQVADLRQPFNPFRYELNLDFTMDAGGVLDRRLGIAAALLLAIVEGRQQ